MKRAIILQLGVLLLLAHTLAAAQPATRSTGSTQFEMRDDIAGPMMHLRVNGQFTGSFVLDSQTAPEFVSEAFVKRIGIKERVNSERGQPYTFKGKPISCVILNAFEIGAIQITDLECPVLPEREFASIFGKSIDGVMSVAFVRNFAMLMDYGSHTIMMMSQGGLTPVEVAALGMAGAASVHARFDPQDYVIKVIARLNDTLDEEMAIGTLTDSTAISPAAAHHLNLKPKGPGTRVAGMTGITKAEYSSLDTLRVGDAVWHDAEIIYAARQPTNLDPCIASDLLRRTAILFDLPANKVYIGPIQPPAPVPPAKQSQDKLEKP